MVALDGDVLRRYPRVSRYNSPYPAHDAGSAVDLYPQTERGAGERETGERATGAPSPVAGEVVVTRTVRCPDRPYAASHDHLVVVDTGDYLARVLHVDPAVEPGDSVAVGDDLGAMVRSGFFAPWVDNHLHVGFRTRDQDPVRASGSLPLDLALDPPVAAVEWDGTGTVVATGETWALLDAPEHPAPGERFAGLASDDGHLLDGGIPHYEQGFASGDGETVSLFGTVVGDRVDDRTVRWRDVTPTADGDPIHGLSLWLGLDWLGVKLVSRGHGFEVGDSVDVGLRPA